MHGEAALPGSLYSRKHLYQGPQGHPPEHASFLLSPTLASISSLPLHLPSLPCTAAPLSAPKQERERVAACETASRTPAIAHTYLYTVIFKMRERARERPALRYLYISCHRVHERDNRRGRRRAEMGNRFCPSPPSPRRYRPPARLFFLRAVVIIRYNNV